MPLEETVLNPVGYFPNTLEGVSKPSIGFKSRGGREVKPFYVFKTDCLGNLPKCYSQLPCRALL
jgi:hypothetical protein